MSEYKEEETRVYYTPKKKNKMRSTPLKFISAD